MGRRTGEKEKTNEKKIVCIRSEDVLIRKETEKIQTDVSLEPSQRVHYGNML